MISVYFAGPDVFMEDYPDAVKRIRRLARERGINPLIPGGDGTPPDGPASLERGRAIYGENIRLLDIADGIIANLRPFRSPVEPDSGTAFEVGYAAAKNKFVIGYLEDRRPLPQRVDSSPLKGKAGSGKDSEGAMVEDFGSPVNLMLACAASDILESLEEAMRIAAEKFGKGKALMKLKG